MTEPRENLSITLQEGRSISILALTWQKRVVPFLGSLIGRVCAILIFMGSMFMMISWLIKSTSDIGRPNAWAGLSYVCSILIAQLFLLAKLVTFWFTGPQSIFLSTAILMMFLTAAKVFRLKFIRNGQTTARVDHDAITVCKNWLNLFFSEKMIRWYELSLASITTKFVDGKSEEFLVFQTTDGKNIEVEASCLNDTSLRVNLISLIKRYAPNALSSELAEKYFLLESSSYADIWMETLHQKHVRVRSRELENGEALSNERFIVMKKLGSGGQGTAYLAAVQYLTDRALKESDEVDKEENTDCEENPVEMVVLKEFILPGFENPALLSEIVARIQHEALLLKSLNHRQIVRVIDAFIEDLRGYLVIEHVNGISLRDYVAKNGPVSESKAIELASQMCSILEYLHGHAPQVVHRDFTPDNLIIDEKGMLKLIDFNLAKVPHLTETALCAGKPPYMAPEQVRGRPEPASDFYSMGALLHFVLTGIDPEPLTVCSPKGLNPCISPSFNNLIERLTHQDLEMRINSASQVRKQLALQGAAHAA